MGIVCPFFVPKNIIDMRIFEAIKDKGSSGKTDRQNGRTAGVATKWAHLLRITLGGEIQKCIF
jgi:hypothetical protein